MTSACPQHTGAIFEHGTAGRPRVGMTESGDRHAVIPRSRGVLIAVVDGLGHGREAAEAATTAIGVLEVEPELPVSLLLERCHKALCTTRGAVMSVASLDSLDQTMTWAGVGNVEGTLMRAGKTGATAREHLIMRGGIVGHRLPVLRAATIPVYAGDLLILATDGIGRGYEKDVNPDARPQEIADYLLPRYGIATDDALVLVGRWIGNSLALAVEDAR